MTLCVTIATNLTDGLLIKLIILGSVVHLISFQKIYTFILIFNSTNYGCGFRFLTGYNRILIPDKEWDLLGHILVPNWGVRKG